MHLFTSKFVEKPAFVSEMPGSVTTPAGFRAAGIAAGIKPSGKKDLGILVSDQECVSAVMFTTSAAAAPPVCVSRDEKQAAMLRGVVANSGSANAATGDQGLEDARSMAEAAAQACDIDPAAMAVASTGVIGERLPMQEVKAGIEAAAAELSPHGGPDFAEAIRTTDSLEKQGAVAVELGGGTVHIGACAKGAGMIAPGMATMLAFITTDAAVGPGLLAELTRAAVGQSFNTISVDGDMSTNDSVFVFASGTAGTEITESSGDRERFAAALAVVCKGLALKMVADGEGATRVVELTVKGASDGDEATHVARAISKSTLVRTAFYGGDANWGRLLAAAGGALAGKEKLAASIFFEDVCVAEGGTAREGVSADVLSGLMEQPEIAVTIDLHRGNGDYRVYFSDLTHDYVTLNSAYTT